MLPSLVLGLSTASVLAAQDARTHFEAGGLFQSTSSQTVTQGAVVDETAPLWGGDGGVRLGPVFVRGSYLKGDFAASGSSPAYTVESWEAGGGFFMLDPLVLDLVAWGRELHYTSTKVWYSGLRVGLGLQLDLIRDLASARLLGHYSAAVKTSVTNVDPSATWDGALEIGVRPVHIPVRAAIGYRLERLDFKHQNGSPITTVLQTRFGGLTAKVQLSL